MAEFVLSAFADEGGKTIEEQIKALKSNGLTHIEPRGLDEGNISTFSAAQARGVAPLGVGQEIHLLINLSCRFCVKALLAVQNGFPFGMPL